MVRKKDQSLTPQSSSTASSSSGSSSSSSSGSSTSGSSSSSDTEASSAVSTRSRTRSRGPSSDKDVSQKSFPSLKKATHPPSKTSSSGYSTGGVSKKGEKAQCDSLPQFPSFPVRKRASSESAPEPVCNSNKRGPKTSATSVPKSHTKTKSAVSSKSQQSTSNSLKPQYTKKTPSIKKPTKKSPIKEVVRDKKQKKSALYSAENSSESEREVRSHKVKNIPKALITPSKSSSKSHPLNPKLSFLSQKKSPESKAIRKGIKSLQKSSENSTNSSLISSGSDSDSCSESSQGGKDKSSVKKVVVSSETEKDDDDGDQQNDNNSRRLVTRSSSVKTKRSSLLGINKTCTDSDSENVVTKSRKSNRANEVKKCIRPLINSSQFDETYVHEPSSKARTNVKKTTQKVKNNMLENVPLPPIENRSCPVEGCNSTGHMGGLYERHFTVDACPVFHNITKAQAKSNRITRLQNNDDRDRAMSLCTKSPRHAQKTEQRNYCNKIRDSRDRMSEVRPGDEDMADSDRQPSLRGLTPDWDLHLFEEAQAEASEKNEDEMRGLPDTKGIRYIQMGHFEMEAWYLSQYPDDYNQQPKIYVCEFCLKYMRSKTILIRHADKCVWKHPPGDEIYRKEKLSVWEVDGTKYKTYCQNLCLLAMLFLDHKTLYYDVEPFLFYIMTIADAEGCHIVGYFSKEKNSFLNYNVSCIMTLPPYQRQGFGRLLIDFSYLLTREEGKIGSPEKPLSDLGLISYRSYWKDLLLKHLSNYPHKNVSIKDLSTEMAVSPYDIVSTFQAMGMMKYWKGKHILLKRQDLFEDFQERSSRRIGANKEIDPKFLNWRPYIPPVPPIEDASADNKDKNNKGGNDKKRPTDLRSGSSESTASLPVKSKRPLIQDDKCLNDCSTKSSENCQPAASTVSTYPVIYSPEV